MVLHNYFYSRFRLLASIRILFSFCNGSRGAFGSGGTTPRTGSGSRSSSGGRCRDIVPYSARKPVPGPWDKFSVRPFDPRVRFVEPYVEMGQVYAYQQEMVEGLAVPNSIGQWLP